MIPKIIHYCWFGGKPLPPLALKCIESWRKYLPDYEIREWNEDNFDVNIIPYTSEAYAMKKYAFVSDYARFWILYKYGGIYFDTDVEVIRPMDDIIEKGNFMGCETDGGKGATANAVAPGLGLGVNPGLGLVKELLDYYSGKHFEFHPDIRSQETIVHITTRILQQNGLKDVAGIQETCGLWIYPSEYFCPVNVTTMRLHITKNTRTIHHYAGTWMGDKVPLKIRIKQKLPENVQLFLSYVKAKIKGK